MQATHWEYLRIVYQYDDSERQWILLRDGQRLNQDSVEACLNAHGLEGWELVATSTYIRSELDPLAPAATTFTAGEVFTFKRPLA
jgi:hypothetical protein